MWRKDRAGDYHKKRGFSDHVCVTAWLHMGPHTQKVEWKPPLLISVLDVCVFQAALSLTAAHLHLRLFPQTVIGRGDIGVNTPLSAIGLTLNDSGHNRVIPLPFIFTILDISALYYPPPPHHLRLSIRCSIPPTIFVDAQPKHQQENCID